MDFPTQFPVDALQTLLGYLRGQRGDLKTLLEAAYEVLGYGLGTVLQSGESLQPRAAFAASYPPMPDRTQLADALQQVLDEHQVHQGRQAVPGVARAAWSPPAWLLPLALQVLQEVIAQLQSRPT